MKKPTILASLAVASLLTPTDAFALGIRVTDQNPFATARGGAFTATADNPSAIYYNPAGITQLEGTRALLGSTVITIEATVDPALPGADLDTKYEPNFVPHSFLTFKAPDSPIALGLGVFSPFGLSLEYDDNSPFRTMAKKGKVQFITIHPVIAWKISDTLSVAAGPTINYSRTKLAQGVVTPGDEFKFEGEGVGYGFNAGVLWQPHPKHSFGLTYHSAVSMHYSGHTRLSIPGFSTSFEVFPGFFVPVDVPGTFREEDADVKFQYPQSIMAGYSFRPTPEWNFEVNVNWTDWDNLNTLTLHQPSGDVELPFNWESSFFYSFGATRYLPNGFRVSAGYIYSENSVPNESFSPLVPDSNRHVISVGVGQETDRISWDLSYQYAYGPHRKIDNGTVANGTYRFESHAIALTLGYRF